MAIVPFSIGYAADIDMARRLVVQLTEANTDLEIVVSNPDIALKTTGEFTEIGMHTEV